MTGRQSIEADCYSAARWSIFWAASALAHLLLLAALAADMPRLSAWCVVWVGLSVGFAAQRYRRGSSLHQLLDHAVDCPHCRARLSEPVG